MIEIERYDCPSCKSYVYVSHGEWSPVLRLTSFAQKGRTIYFGSAPAMLIDAITEVPRIPEEKPYDELAGWMLGNIKAWQRPLDPDRIEAIGNFWTHDLSFFVNPVILGVNPEVPIEATEVANEPLPVVEVRFKNWFVSECPEGHTDEKGRFFDACPDHECPHHQGIVDVHRPIQIIDGQHRTRGTQAGSSPVEKNPSTGELYAMENLPLVLLRSDVMDSFDLQLQAKIFTEITTKGEPLAPNHMVFLMYKFAQMGEVDKFGDLDLRPGTADYKAYEACLRIVGSEFGNTNANPWRKRIPPIRGRPGLQKVASLHFIFRSIAPLFRPGKSFDGLLPYDVAQVLVAFGQSIVLTWDRLSPGGRYYWYPPHTHVPAVTEQSGIISTAGGGDNTTWLRILFSLLEEIVKETETQKPSRPQLMQVMQRILACNFEGAGWDQIPGQEARENYMASVLADIVTKTTGGKVATEMEKFGISDINDYVSRPPLMTEPEVKGAGPIGANGKPTLRKGTSVLVYLPFNIQGELRVLFIQRNQVIRETIIERPVRASMLDLELEEGTHYQPGRGEVVTVTLTCRNPVGSTTRSLQVEVP